MYTKTIEKTMMSGDKQLVTVPNVTKIIIHSVLALIALIFVFGSFGTIDAGERGVQIRMGNVIGTKEPGLYMKLPMIDKIKVFNTKTQNVIYERETPLASASADLQDVQIATVVNYKLDATGVQKIYAEFGSQSVFEENVIRPAVRDTVKATASNFNAEELVTKRAEFTDAIQVKLAERLSSKFVIIERVNVTDLKFSSSFSQAIEAKVTAEQEAQAAKNKLEQVKFEAQQQIEKAKAEAETIQIQAQAINSQGGEDYVNLKAVEKWNGVLPVQMIPGSSVPFVNLK